MTLSTIINKTSLSYASDDLPKVAPENGMSRLFAAEESPSGSLSAVPQTGSGTLSPLPFVKFMSHTVPTAGIHCSKKSVNFKIVTQKAQ